MLPPAEASTIIARSAALLAELGLRVGEALALDLSALRWNKGHCTVRVAGKGGKVLELSIPAPLGCDLDAYLAPRAAAARVPVDGLTDPLFVLVRRVAHAAGLPNAALRDGEPNAAPSTNLDLYKSRLA